MTYQIRRPTEMMMQVYSECVSAYKARCDTPTPRLDLEEIVRLANRAFESAVELDLSVNESDEVPADPATVKVIPGLYLAWGSSTRELLAVIARVESRGMTIRGADDLDANLQVVSAILPGCEDQPSALLAATAEFAA